MTRVLLTVSGAVPDGLASQVEAGRRPRVDHQELAAVLDADVIDLTEALDATGPVGRLLHRLAGAGPVIALAVFLRRHRYDVVVTDGEQVGLPLAVLLLPSRRRPRHAMIAHVMSVTGKSVGFRALRLRTRIDRMFVYATAQLRFVTDVLGVAPGRVVLTPFQVDTSFFRPATSRVGHGGHGADTGRALVCAAGLERRDYRTLVAAVRDLDVDVVIAAASPWSRWRRGTVRGAPPPNVTVCALDLAELRDLYDRADVVAVPLEESDFQAGITTVLEAMAMARPVVCSRTAGQTDTIIDGVTGVYVPPGDVSALRSAIVSVVEDPCRAACIGAAARRWAVHHADIDVYCRTIADHVAELAGGAPAA